MTTPPLQDKDSLWGHKVTVHIYVPGDLHEAADVSDRIANADIAEHDPRIVFLGISISEVQDEPKEMMGTGGAPRSGI